jgi:NADH dehydrogenase
MMTPVHVGDVAAAFVAALDDESTVGETFALGGPEALSWAEMLKRVAAAVGRRKWILPVPIGLMRMAATAFDRLPFFPVTRGQLTMLAQGNTAKTDALLRLIGRKPRRFSAETLAYLRG